MWLAPALNDENSTLNGPAQFRQQPAKQGGSVLKSARKVFGNISNNGQTLGSDASVTKPQAKTQPQRRAFGDISNSAAKPPAGPTTAKKQPGTSSLFAAPVTNKASTNTPAQGSNQTATADASSNKTEWWQELEPERPAGKTWEQQEAEREAAMETDAMRSADAIWSSVMGKGVCSFLVPPMPVDSDEEEAAALQPLGGDVVPWGADCEPVPAMPSEELQLPADLASLLPDIHWPSSEGVDAAVAADNNTTAAESVEELAAADVLIDTVDAGSRAADAVSSPQSPAAPQTSADSCNTPAADACDRPHELQSPEALPW